MTASDTDSAPGPRGSWLWAGGLSAILVLIVSWEAIRVGADAVEPPVAESLPSTDPKEGRPADLWNVYGMSAADLGLIAASAAESDARVVVAGFPGVQRAAGPVLTRSERPKRLLPKGRASDTAVIEPLGRGWKQIGFPEAGPDVRGPNLATADISVVDGESGERRRCTRIGLREFSCADPGWARVDRRRIEIGGARRSCIWAHPLEDRTIVIDFGAVEGTDTAPQYRLRTAIRDRVATSGGPVDVSVQIGGRRLDVTHRPQKGWQSETLPLVDAPARLQIEVSAEQVGQRHFCFDISSS